MLIPRGWTPDRPIDNGRETEGEWSVLYTISPTNESSDIGQMEIVASRSRTEASWHDGHEPESTNSPEQKLAMERHVSIRSEGLWAAVYYTSTDAAAFKRTWPQIRDSLTID